MIMNHPFRYFNSSPEVIRLAVMMYIRYPLSLRQVEDVLFERGIDICHETVRYGWNRFGPMFAGEIRKRRVHGRNWSNWRWHLDEVLERIERHYLWRAVDLLALASPSMTHRSRVSLFRPAFGGRRYFSQAVVAVLVVCDPGCYFSHLIK